MKQTVAEIRRDVFKEYPQYLPHLLTFTEQKRLILCFSLFQSDRIKQDRAIHSLQQSRLAEALKASMGEEQYEAYARTSA